MLKRAAAKAAELGATQVADGYWNWAVSFPSREIAEQFLIWLDKNGYQHKGIYYAIDSNDPKKPSVKYRRRRHDISAVPETASVAGGNE